MSFNPPPVSRPGETRTRPQGSRELPRFNPPPVSRPGETSSCTAGSRSVRAFQSAPGLATGGNLQPQPQLQIQLRFQSAPGLATGGNRRSGRISGSSASFNPPPVSRPGETMNRAKSTAGGKMFQSAPGLATGGNLLRFGAAGRINRFQSAPGLATGGNQWSSLVWQPIKYRFNPPPVSRPGETTDSRVRRFVGVSCFNPPPVSRPGETSQACSVSPDRSPFQSAPGLATGGNRCHRQFL